jgi:hypothetical protein
MMAFNRQVSVIRIGRHDLYAQTHDYRAGSGS